MGNNSIPNSNQATVQAYMKTKSFLGDATQAGIEKMDAEVSAFLATIDNRTRFLNGRNSYAVNDKVYTLVWYLERIEDSPVTTPFGKKDVKQPNPSTQKSS